MKRSILLSTALLGLLLGASGCEDESNTVAGGEDFPNTVSGMDALARLAKEASDSSGDWNPLREAPSAIPGDEPDTTAVGFVAKAIVAGRVGALETLEVDLSDTAKGRAVLRVRKVTSEGTQDDTISIVWNDRAKDTIKDNEWVYGMSSRKTTFTPFRTEYSRVEPSGVDTMVTPLAGKANRIRLRKQVTQGVATTVLDMIIDPGPDLSYDSEDDNCVFRALAVRLRGTDTLESSRWEDGDGDSIALDRASGKVGIVSYVRTIPSPAGVRLSRVEERGRLRVDPRDSTATEPLRYERKEQWRSGRVVVERIARSKTDSDLVASDTAFVSRVAILGTDTLRTRFDLLMGAKLSDSTSHRILGYTVYLRSPNGRTLSLRFVSDHPIVPGETVLTGKVLFDADLPEGKSFHLDGRWNQGALSGHVDDGEAISGTASWDAAGNLVAWKPD